AERDILLTHAPGLLTHLPDALRLVELGSGNSAKTRILLTALLERRPELHYVPIDICSATLQQTALALLRDYPGLAITALAAEYHDGLRYLRNEAGQPQLILWLGSNVGNFHRDEAAAFLRTVRAAMAPPDRLLVGIDLRKDRATLEAAYDDAQS